MLVQLVRVAKLLGPSNIFISVYESGSSDFTPEWLQLLGSLLRTVSVRSIITAGGSLTRAPGQDRISFLSTVRQAAIDQVLAACNGTAAEFCNASRIVFVNDVFFDASGLVRLLQYGADDVACGLDFEPILADHLRPQQQQYMTQHLQQLWRVPAPLAARLASWQPTFKLWRRRYRHADSLLSLLPLSFYDIWVARDVGGGRLYRNAPYTHHNATAQRLQQGLPVSAHCCWNGMVALRGLPLLSRRVAFRTHADGECYASECTLLCSDLHALGPGPARVVIDPGVRVAYRVVAAKKMYGMYSTGSNGTEAMAAAAAVANSAGPAAPPDLPYVSWNRTLLADLEAWRQEQDVAPTVECCGLEPGRDAVDFEHGCARIPVSWAAAAALAPANLLNISSAAPTKHVQKEEEEDARDNRDLL